MVMTRGSDQGKKVIAKTLDQKTYKDIQKPGGMKAQTGHNNSLLISIIALFGLYQVEL